MDLSDTIDATIDHRFVAAILQHCDPPERDGDEFHDLTKRAIAATAELLRIRIFLDSGPGKIRMERFTDEELLRYFVERSQEG